MFYRRVIDKIDQSEFEGFEYVNPLLMSREDCVWHESIDDLYYQQFIRKHEKNYIYELNNKLSSLTLDYKLDNSNSSDDDYFHEVNFYDKNRKNFFNSNLSDYSLMSSLPLNYHNNEEDGDDNDDDKMSIVYDRGNNNLMNKINDKNDDKDDDDSHKKLRKQNYFFPLYWFVFFFSPTQFNYYVKVLKRKQLRN